MANAVTVIFGANSTQFQAELGRMQAMARAAAGKMSSGIGGIGGHGPKGMTGVIRETTVIGREIAMGRGLGRILGSMTLLVQYLKSFTSGAEKASSYTDQLAAGYQRLALKANVAAIAAMKKAEATAAAAYAENLEDIETIKAAEADAAKAASATAEAIAAQEKSAAAIEAAEAEELEAAATEQATVSSLPLMAIFFGIIAVLALMYGAYKVVSAVINQFKERQIEANKAAYEGKLNFEEEASALERLRKEAERTDDALAKLGESHDKTVEHVKTSIGAWDAYYDAQKKAYDLMKEGAMIQIGTDEKLGKITKLEAVNARADVEKATLDKQHAIEDEQLRKKRDTLANAAEKAANVADEKAKEAKAAELNSSPESIAKVKEIDRLKKIEDADRKEADDVAKKASEMPVLTKWERGQKETQDNRAKILNIAADMAMSNRIDAEKLLKPDELAAAEKLRHATEARSAANELSEQHKSAAQEYGSFERNSGMILWGQKHNIDLKRQQEILDSVHTGNGYEMNSQQKIGAYAATPPEFKQMADFLRIIAMQTHYLVPQQAPAPGHRPPQHGTIPQVQSMPGSAGSGA